jgi:exodeoxyribonuclease V alpha subunit
VNPLVFASRPGHPLVEAVAEGIVESRHVAGATVLMDLAFDGSMGERTADEWLLVALALQSPEGEHSCLDLADMPRYVPKGAESPIAGRLLLGEGHWRSVALSLAGLVGSPDQSQQSPLILDGRRLYLARLFADECFVSDDLRVRSAKNALSVLMGGPGSGKTTLTAARLLDLLRDAPQGFSIALAAPTGKAALRMRSVLSQKVEEEARRETLDEAGFQRALAVLDASESTTVHRLLGFTPTGSRRRYVFDRSRRLPHDLVILDECSMLSLELLTNLLRAVRDDASLWIVGDADQLASVGAGTVLSDIREAARRPGSPLAKVEELDQMHRFSDEQVKALVAAVRDAGGKSGQSLDRQVAACFDVLDGAHGALKWVDPDVNRDEVEDILNATVRRARGVAAAASGDLAEEETATWFAQKDNDVQLLCVHRAGRLGVAGINQRVRAALGARAAELWYPGRPVMVTRNDRRTNLFNGDTGTVVRRPDGSKVVVLAEPIGREPVPVARIEHHELAYAMTVHKSQGSEFSEVVAIMPTEPSGLCTREMLYTAISRTKDRLTLVASRAVLDHMLRTPISRATGLADRFGA